MLAYFYCAVFNCRKDLDDTESIIYDVRWVFNDKKINKIQKCNWRYYQIQKVYAYIYPKLHRYHFTIPPCTTSHRKIKSQKNLSVFSVHWCTSSTTVTYFLHKYILFDVTLLCIGGIFEITFHWLRVADKAILVSLYNG